MSMFQLTWLNRFALGANLNTLEEGGLFIRCNIYVQEFSKERGGGRINILDPVILLFRRPYVAGDITTTTKKLCNK